MTIALEGLCPLLQVFDMPASLGFYCGVLGFELVQCAPSQEAIDWCLLRRDGMELMLNTRYERAQRPAQAEAAAMAAHADTALYIGCRDLDAAYRWLCVHGMDADAPVVAPYGMKQLYLRDPDGYVVCLQWRV